MRVFEVSTFYFISGFKLDLFFDMYKHKRY